MFLSTGGYELTARQVILALGSYLAEFGDRFTDPGAERFFAIDDQVRYGDLTGWMHARSPREVAVIRARAEQIARDYFGRYFPPVTW